MSQMSPRLHFKEKISQKVLVKNLNELNNVFILKSIIIINFVKGAHYYSDHTIDHFTSKCLVTYDCKRG